jgi:hypothetical protein
VRERDLARNLAFVRIALGVVMIVLPGTFGRVFLGPEARRPLTRVLARMLGVRDFALGVATLRSTDNDEGLRAMLQLSAACDTVDALATVVGYRQLPKLRRALVLLSAAGAAAIGGGVAVALPTA